MLVPQRAELQALVGVLTGDGAARGAPREVRVEPTGILGIERFADAHRGELACPLVLAVEPLPAWEPWLAAAA